MRVLFLDFDGVLHSVGSGARGNTLFSRLPLLHRVLEQNASLRVVVHSTWRSAYKDDELRDFLFHSRPELASRFLGVTPRKVLGRWTSILAWFQEHGRVSSCVLDDAPDEFPAHVVKGQDPLVAFVECPSNSGLCEHSPAWEKLRKWVYSAQLERSTP